MIAVIKLALLHLVIQYIKIVQKHFKNVEDDSEVFEVSELTFSAPPARIVSSTIHTHPPV